MSENQVSGSNKNKTMSSVFVGVSHNGCLLFTVFSFMQPYILETPNADVFDKTNFTTIEKSTRDEKKLLFGTEC